MNKTKLTTLILIAIIAILSFYTVFSGNRKQKEIKRLTIELNVYIDSIKNISNRYFTIYKEYEIIYKQLDSTRLRMDSFFKQVDSISHTTITSIDKLKQTIELIKKEKKYIETIDDTPIGPIFQ